MADLMTLLKRNFDASRGLKRKAIKGYSTSEIQKALEYVGKGLIGDSFQIDEYNEKLYRSMSWWILACSDKDVLDPLKGLYIYGNTGTGKTMSMKVLSAFLKSVGIEYQKGGKDHRMELRIVNAQEINQEYAHTGDFYKYVEEPMLCVNDLGTELVKKTNGTIASESIYMGNRVEVLKTLIELRGERDLFTFFTSNYPIESPVISQIYGERVTSRLKAMATEICLAGNDRRLL